MKIFFQKIAYSTAMLLAPVIVLPVFFFFKRGRERIFDRLGFWNVKVKDCVWFHGASLGEMQGLSKIAKELKAQSPGINLVASCTSPTAISKAKEFTDDVRLLPFDHPIFFKKAISDINPKIFIFGETEIWPNLLSFLKKRNVPCYLVNGRISDSALKSYLKLKSFFAEALASITSIFASSQKSKQNFLRLGAKDEQVLVIPNTKYDFKMLENNSNKDLRKALFASDQPVVVFASIRPGEEDLIFPAIQSLEKKGRYLNYIIAPRHTEKFQFFKKRLSEYSIEFSERTSQEGPTTKRTLFLDTIGELASLIKASDLCFVGGTLADYGGHNPLEAAQVGVAPVIGPYYSTVSDVVERLEADSALFKVKDSKQIEDLLSKLSDNSLNFSQIGDNAKKVADSFSGGTQIIIKRISSSEGVINDLV